MASALQALLDDAVFKCYNACDLNMVFILDKAKDLMEVLLTS